MATLRVIMSVVRSLAVKRWESLLEVLSWTKRFALAEAKGLARVYVPYSTHPKSKRARATPKIM